MRPDSYRTRVYDSGDPYAEEGANQNINKVNVTEKTLSTVALVVSSFALGTVAMYIVLQGQLIDSKIAAGVAKSEATAAEARTNSRVALDKVEDVRAKLAEKGIQIGPLDGH